jgi:hypothetical protein
MTLVLHSRGEKSAELIQIEEAMQSDLDHMRMDKLRDLID